MTTKGASFSYEEVIDLHTESDRVTVIGIHTPTTDTPRRMAPGLFAQFKKFKYLGCSVTMVPAATLPVDPLGVSYEAGEPTVDPRDMLNPILFHGCHGNDLGNILDRIYSAGAVEGSDLSQLLHSDSTSLWSLLNQPDEDSVSPLTILESLYYRALTDRTWQKANIQRGFRKTGLHPRIYTLATNMQLQNAEYLMANEFSAPAPFSGEKSTDPYLGEVWDVEDTTANPVRFFTPRTQRLGWLDTRQVVPYTASEPYADPTPLPNKEIQDIIKVSTVDTKLPRIYMGVILLPPAYKQEQYFRMVITHRFAFAGFRGISMSNLELENPNYFNLNAKISSGDSDDPDSPDDPSPPDPPTPPEPPVDYRRIVLSGASESITSGGKIYENIDIYNADNEVVFYMRGGSSYGWAAGSDVSSSAATLRKAGTLMIVVTNGAGGLLFPFMYLQDDDGTLNIIKRTSSSAYTYITQISEFLPAIRAYGSVADTTLTSMAEVREVWQYPIEVAE